MMHDKTQADRQPSLNDELFGELAAQLLIVGDLPPSQLSDVPDGVSIHRLTCLADAEGHTSQPGTQTLHAGDIPRVLVLELNPREAQFEQCLGRAIRACPHRVMLHCVATEAVPGPGDDAFFALGFRKLSVVPSADMPGAVVRWFEYRMSQYKPAPDWLNARFWANPDRFDVDEDPDGFYEESDDEEE